MYRLGEIVQAKLIEQIDDSHWIVSFEGQLVQVVNESPIGFEKNKTIKLKITKEKPLKLQILASRFYRKTIDVKV